MAQFGTPGAESFHEVTADSMNTSLLVSTAGPRGPYVLRTPEMLRDTGSVLGACKEYEVLAKLQETAVDAPEPVVLCGRVGCRGAVPRDDTP